MHPALFSGGKSTAFHCGPNATFTPHAILILRANVFGLVIPARVAIVLAFRWTTRPEAIACVATILCGLARGAVDRKAFATDGAPDRGVAFVAREFEALVAARTAILVRSETSTGGSGKRSGRCDEKDQQRRARRAQREPHHPCRSMRAYTPSRVPRRVVCIGLPHRAEIVSAVRLIGQARSSA
jgi:hypothetical protein